MRRHLTFENFGEIPRYVVSLDGQMPYRQALQKASNPLPNHRLFKIFPMRQTVYSDVKSIKSKCPSKQNQNIF